jgi:hypothetical protein
LGEKNSTPLIISKYYCYFCQFKVKCRYSNTLNKEIHMKKRMVISVSVVLLLTMAAVIGIAVAQGGVTWGSSYQIQNLDSTVATVALAYYDQSTGDVAATGTITVAGNGSKTVFPFTSGTFGDGISGPASFNGSLVLSSDKQIAAILNTASKSGVSYAAATGGFSAGGTTVNIPLVACNNAGFNTWFNVQNAGSNAANFTVQYIPGSSGTAGLSDTVTGLKAGAAKTFDQQTGSSSGTKTCAQLADGSGKFVGSAKVTSTNGEPLVASVMFLGTGSIKTLQGYNSFPSGSTAVNLPLVMSNNGSYYTSIQVQNAGTTTTTLTVTFGTNTQGSNNPVAEVFALGPGAAKTLLQVGGISPFSPSNNWTAIGRYVGGAVITQSGTEPLVAVVNQNSTTYTSLGTAYEGFDPASASATVNLPLIAANNGGYATSMQIQAVSGSPAVTVDYTTNTGGGALLEPVNDTKSLTTGQVWTLMQSGNNPALSGVNNWTTAGRYVGSAKVTVTGGTVIAIVNFLGPATGDTFYTYDGFNQ